MKMTTCNELHKPDVMMQKECASITINVCNKARCTRFKEHDTITATIMKKT